MHIVNAVRKILGKIQNRVSITPRNPFKLSKSMQINFKKLNPLGFHLLKLLQDTAIRLIILFGGSSSGKSYSVAQLILIMTLWDGGNTLVMRKVGASISKTIYEDFKVASKQLGIFSLFKFKDGVRQIVCIPNGAKIDFGGLDDPEKDRKSVV